MNIDVNTIRMAPEDIAIRILNEIPYSELEGLFRENEDLWERYGELYRLGIEEYIKYGDIDGEMEIGGGVGEYETMDEYFEKNRLGLLSNEISAIMREYNKISSIIIGDITVGGRQVYTMEMLLNWWYIYVGMNGLQLEDGNIRSDMIMDALFADEYRKYGISYGIYSRNYLSMILVNHFTGDIQINADDELLELLYDEALRLREMLGEYTKILNVYEPRKTFLESVIEYGEMYGLNNIS